MNQIVGNDQVAGPRVPALDGLRGIAILLVMVCHFVLYGGVPNTSRAFDSAVIGVLRTGWIGLDLFFVLSGFLITGVLYDGRGGSHYLRNFHARRVLRILPLFYGSLVLWLVVLPRVWVAHEGLQSLRIDAPWYWLNLVNVNIARSGWPTFGALGHFWSLAVEEQFYIVWPFVILLFSRRALIRICVASIAGALLLRVALSWYGLELPAYVLMPVRMDALAMGSLIALVARGTSGVAPLTGAAAIVFPLATVGLVPIYVRAGGLFSEDVLTLTVGLSLLALAFGSLLVLALASPSGALGRPLTAPPLRLLGRYSYGIYVFHHPMLFFVPAALTVANLPVIAGSYVPAVLLFSTGAGVLSVALGITSWHLYEKHFLKLKVLFLNRPATEPRQPRPETPTVVAAAGAPGH